MKPLYKFALRSDLQDNPEFLPTKANSSDTGWDVKAAMPDKLPLTVRPGELVKVPLGFRVVSPEGWWLKLEPRSSTFTKLKCISHAGIIDQDFFLEMLFAFKYSPFDNSDLTINFGQTIAQIVPFKLQEMVIESISNEDMEQCIKSRNATRTGGFGSSDGPK